MPNTGMSREERYEMSKGYVQSKVSHFRGSLRLETPRPILTCPFIYCAFLIAAKKHG